MAPKIDNDRSVTNSLTELVILSGIFCKACIASLCLCVCMTVVLAYIIMPVWGGGHLLYQIDVHIMAKIELELI